MSTSLFDLSGKVALVTGSTSGLGKAISGGLAAAGATVIVNGRNVERLDESVAALKARGLKAEGHAFDVTSEAAVIDAVARIERQVGPIDILVNNAGIQHVEAIETFPPEKWDQIIAINLSAAFHTTSAAIPGMKARGWGRIINIASAHGLVASPFKSAYVAAKHGIVGLTKTAALETAENGITVNAICPGYVLTPLVQKQIPETAQARGISEEDVIKTVILHAQPTHKFVGVDEIAALALFLCSPGATSITGAALSIDGGWTAE
jgi:3-hydroxybutyrate dehydrogenase